MRALFVTCAFSALSLVAATPVAAQDFYAGLAYDLARPHGGGDQDLGSIIAGARFGQSTLTYGAELDYGIGLGSAADHDTLRLRGLIHNDLGRFGLFGGLGWTQYDLEAGGTAAGFNYGLGADYSISDRTDLRLEVIRDHVPDYDSSGVTTIRAGVTFGF